MLKNKAASRPYVHDTHANLGTTILSSPKSTFEPVYTVQDDIGRICYSYSLVYLILVYYRRSLQWKEISLPLEARQLNLEIWRLGFVNSCVCIVCNVNHKAPGV